MTAARFRTKVTIDWCASGLLEACRARVSTYPLSMKNHGTQLKPQEHGYPPPYPLWYMCPTTICTPASSRAPLSARNGSGRVELALAMSFAWTVAVARLISTELSEYLLRVSSAQNVHLSQPPTDCADAAARAKAVDTTRRIVAVQPSRSMPSVLSARGAGSARLAAAPSAMSLRLVVLACRGAKSVAAANNPAATSGWHGRCAAAAARARTMERFIVIGSITGSITTLSTSRPTKGVSDLGVSRISSARTSRPAVGLPSGITTTSVSTSPPTWSRTSEGWKMVEGSRPAMAARIASACSACSSCDSFGRSSEAVVAKTSGRSRREKTTVETTASPGEAGGNEIGGGLGGGMGGDGRANSNPRPEAPSLRSGLPPWPRAYLRCGSGRAEMGNRSEGEKRGEGVGG
eukprot:scaffold12543_cov115-Isochrysis_galbana.AAC.7